MKSRVETVIIARPTQVAPLAGAWIEIGLPPPWGFLSGSPPSRGRGLK